MPEVVTRLVVAADGSLRALDQFEKGMEDAGRATDYTSGAVADFERRMNAARAAIDRGNAVTLQSVQRKSAEERAWERWSATVDRTTALRIRLEREAANASVAATNAVIAGHASQEQALATLTALEQRHNGQIAASIAMRNREASAIDNATAAMHANTAAANSNVASKRNAIAVGTGGQGFATANVAAQFQDIGVTSAMGMSPLMIALQQGTQLSAVLGQQGLTGVVRTLGAAFASILSPVSLLTIGIVAAGAAGIQALMGIFNNADEATDAIELHREEVAGLMRGYEDAEAAAQRYMELASRMPEAAVESDLETMRDDWIETRRDQVERLTLAAGHLQTVLERNRNIEAFALPEGTLAELQGALDVMRAIPDPAYASTTQLNALVAPLTVIANTAADERVRNTADAMLELLINARDSSLEVDGLGQRLNSLPSSVNVRINVQMEGFLDAQSDLLSLMPDLRDRFTRLRDDAEAAYARQIGAATDEILRIQANKDYESVLAGIDAAEAQANAPRPSRGSGRSGSGGGGASAADPWGSTVENFQQRIEQQRMEAELIGLGTYEVERQRAAYDLLNQAKAAGLEITPALNEQIDSMATSFADASLAMRTVSELLAPEVMPWDVLGEQMHGLDLALAQGVISWEQYGAAAQRAHMLAASSTLGAVGQITSTLAGAFETNKAFALANAVVNTAQGITAALAGPPPFSFLQAAAVAAAGAAQISTIMSAKKGSATKPSVAGGGSSGSGGAAAAPAAPTRQTNINVTMAGSGLFTRDDLSSMLDQIAEGLNDGLGHRFKVAVNS